jgi:hypothetical protein
MDPQLLETLTQSRWAIAFVTAAVATVWLRQRGKTQRMALLCATAYESTDSSIPRAELLEEAKSTKVSTFAQIVLAFGKLPEVTQRRCTTMGFIMSGAVPLGVFMSPAIFAISHDRRLESNYYHSVHNYPSNTIQADPTGATRLSATESAVSRPTPIPRPIPRPTPRPTSGSTASATARSTANSTPASKSPATLPDRISVVSVSAMLEEEGIAPIPSLNTVDQGTSVLSLPTVYPLVAAESSFTSIDRPASQRHGRFDRLAALTQFSCHDSAATIIRMEF